MLPFLSLLEAAGSKLGGFAKNAYNAGQGFMQRHPGIRKFADGALGEGDEPSEPSPLLGGGARPGADSSGNFSPGRGYTPQAIDPGLSPTQSQGGPMFGHSGGGPMFGDSGGDMFRPTPMPLMRRPMPTLGGPAVLPPEDPAKQRRRLGVMDY